MRLDMIRASDLKQYVNRPDCLIVDLRNSEEYKRGHVPSAVNIPYQELNTAALPRTKTIVFYCQRGSISLSICRRMNAMGFSTLSVNGGFQAYVSSTS